MVKVGSANVEAAGTVYGRVLMRERLVVEDGATFKGSCVIDDATRPTGSGRPPGALADGREPTGVQDI